MATAGRHWDSMAYSSDAVFQQEKASVIRRKEGHGH